MVFEKGKRMGIGRVDLKSTLPSGGLFGFLRYVFFRVSGRSLGFDPVRVIFL
jgi:hypothetical protein